jgi:hypothetical protein
MSTIKLDWQPASPPPTKDDLPVAIWYPNSKEMGVSYHSVAGFEGYQWAHLSVEPPEEEAPDPLAAYGYARGIREAVIAASNAPSADAARRWFSDRFIEVIEREGI